MTKQEGLKPRNSDACKSAGSRSDVHGHAVCSSHRGPANERAFAELRLRA